MATGNRGGAHFSSGSHTRKSADRGRNAPRAVKSPRREFEAQTENIGNDEYVDISSYSSPKEKNQTGSKKAGAKSTRKKILVSIVCIVLALLFGLIGSGFIYVGSLFGKYTYAPATAAAAAGGGGGAAQPIDVGVNVSSKGKNSPAQSQKTYDDPEIVDGLYHDDAVLNILLVGSDSRGGGDVGRTDTMILLSIDRRHKELKLTSFMRDMYIYIPDWSQNRINVAYTLGGPELLMRTIEDTFHIDIDRYAEVDFDAFADIVDALGGVEIELSQAEADVINLESGEWESFAVSGLNTLTGKQACYYARIRNVSNEENSDFGRTIRQRTLLSSIVKKFKGSDLTTIMNLANQIVPLIKSDLTQEEIFALVTDALTYMKYDIKQCRLPSDEMFYLDWVTISGQGASVIQLNTEEWNAIYVNEFIYGDDFPELKATLEANGYTPCDGKKYDTEN